MSLMSCTAGIAPPVDDLVEFPFSLERSTATRLIKAGELPARKLGRKWYAKRSDVLGLIDKAPRAKPARASGESLRADLAAIADRTRNAGAK
jgi:hypothetical protein